LGQVLDELASAGLTLVILFCHCGYGHAAYILTTRMLDTLLFAACGLSKTIVFREL
jgi:hypothetical protein